MRRVHQNQKQQTSLMANAYKNGRNGMAFSAMPVIQQRNNDAKDATSSIKEGGTENNHSNIEKEIRVKGGESYAKQSVLDRGIHKPFQLKRIGTVQREIVRVGYDAVEAQSLNPFIKGKHNAIDKKVAILPATDNVYDYSIGNGALNLARQGNPSNVLHVVGHGQPGVIGGVDASVLAQNIKVNLPNNAANITSVKLHSCFSNIPEKNGNSSGAKFNVKFINMVEAASGIHYADNATNLPPRFTGFKYAAKSAKKAFIKQYANEKNINLLDSDPQSILANKAKMVDAAKLFNLCTTPLEQFLKTNIAVMYQGLDPADNKTVNNLASYDHVLSNLGKDMDEMPVINYPEEIKSIISGIDETYVFAKGCFEKSILFYKGKNPGKFNTLKIRANELKVAYKQCQVNYQNLIAIF